MPVKTTVLGPLFVIKMIGFYTKLGNFFRFQWKLQQWLGKIVWGEQFQTQQTRNPFYEVN